MRARGGSSGVGGRPGPRRCQQRGERRRCQPSTWQQRRCSGRGGGVAHGGAAWRPQHRDAWPVRRRQHGHWHGYHGLLQDRHGRHDVLASGGAAETHVAGCQWRGEQGTETRRVRWPEGLQGNENGARAAVGARQCCNCSRRQCAAGVAPCSSSSRREQQQQQQQREWVGGLRWVGGHAACKKQAPTVNQACPRACACYHTTASTHLPLQPPLQPWPCRVPAGRRPRPPTTTCQCRCQWKRRPGSPPLAR